MSTRVDTTVAIEFAASCQPLENSKASVRDTTTIEEGSWTWKAACLQALFKNDAFNYVGDVFALIHRGFDDLENFLPLDDLDWVLFFVEKLSDQRAAQTVALVFAAIDFDGEFKRFFGSW